ncbi:hypothetical protein ACIQOU_16555 [Streptomyces sp. NPDC091279]
MHHRRRKKLTRHLFAAIVSGDPARTAARLERRFCSNGGSAAGGCRPVGV